MLSIWQDTVCRATLRLATEDVPDFVAMLTRTVISADDEDDDSTPLLDSAG